MSGWVFGLILAVTIILTVAVLAGAAERRRERELWRRAEEDTRTALKERHQRVIRSKPLRVRQSPTSTASAEEPRRHNVDDGNCLSSTYLLMSALY